jgi:hypothetical protein
MSALAPGPCSAASANHDLIGEDEMIETCNKVDVVQAVPEAAAISECHFGDPSSSAQGAAATSSGQAVLQKNHQEDLKFTVACMPILRIKVCCLIDATCWPEFPHTATSQPSVIYIHLTFFPLPRC